MLKQPVNSNGSSSIKFLLNESHYSYNSFFSLFFVFCFVFFFLKMFLIFFPEKACSEKLLSDVFQYFNCFNCFCFFFKVFSKKCPMFSFIFFSNLFFIFVFFSIFFNPPLNNIFEINFGKLLSQKYF